MTIADIVALGDSGQSSWLVPVEELEMAKPEEHEQPVRRQIAL